jgi:hypothetical protein
MLTASGADALRALNAAARRRRRTAAALRVLIACRCRWRNMRAACGA